MEHVLALIVTLLIFGLWYLPVHVIYDRNGDADFGFIYGPIVFITIGWLLFLGAAYL